MTFASIEDVEAFCGNSIQSPAIHITQELIDDFAQATGDRQWIHTDRMRAQRESPYATTIAHGFLTLSLLSRMFRESCTIATERTINYGLEHVRFVSPVRSDALIRGTFTLGEARRIDGGIDLRWDVDVRTEGAEKPALVAQWLVRLYF